MRVLTSFLIGILAAATVAAFVVLVMQNSQGVQLGFLGTTAQLNAGGAVAGAGAVGFLLALLLLLPGRLASAWRTANLSRQGQSQEKRLAALREQYAALQGSHQRLLDEHQQVMGQVLPGGVAGQPAAEREPVRSFAPLPHTGPIAPLPARRNDASLGDRMRDRFGEMQAEMQASWSRLRARLRQNRRRDDRRSPSSRTDASAPSS